jgi:protoporphyrinogen oxidase
VDVFEKEHSIGGFCDTRVIDGFTFDLGPHVFGRRILKLAPFKPGDLDPANFSESFLVQGRILDFPLDFLFEGYITDIIGTLATNTVARREIDPTDMEELSTASYGSAINQAIFRPLIEKWCQTAMTRLDGRYFASRLHSKLEIGAVTGYIRRLASSTLDWLTRGDRASRSADGPEQSSESGGIPPARGYSGSIGARIVPDRLAGAVRPPAIHTDLPVTRLGVQKGRIVWVEAGGREIRPEFVISTIPLNRLAAMMVGSHRLKSLEAISYLNILFVFVRIARPSLLKTEWTWIPDPGIPFYRMSEMKVLNPDHAPANATGLCLEVSFLANDRRREAPDAFWKKQALGLLNRTFGIKPGEIMGMTIERRTDAYPNFDKKNTSLIARYVKRAYKPRHTFHSFDLGIENLALAGRPGTFLYLLTPEAIRSGLRAAQQAVEYAGERGSRSRDGARPSHRLG